MTRSLWRDPVYEEMDEISKRILPYLPSKNALDAVGDINVITLHSQEILEAVKNDYSVTARGLITNKFRYGALQGVEVEFVDPPSEIVLDYTTNKLNIESLKVRLRFAVDRDTIEQEINRMFASTPDVMGTPVLIKSVAKIFDNDKITYRRQDKIVAAAMMGCKMWLKRQDIRAMDFVRDILYHMVNAMDGNMTSLLWLKVLKARASDKEPIYSMELT